MSGKDKTMKSISIHLFYGLLLAAFALYHWQMNQKTQTLWKQAGKYAEMGSRCTERQSNMLHLDLEKQQMAYRSKSMDNNMNRLDTLLHYIDTLSNNQVSMKCLNQVLHKLTPGDSDLHFAVDSLITSVMANQCIPQHVENQFFALKKNILKTVICTNFAKKMAMCGEIGYGPLTIALTNSPICPAAGDTVSLDFGIAPTAALTEKMFSEVRFSVNGQPVNSEGFSGFYPMVFTQKGRQQIDVTAQTTDVMTGEIRTYQRTFEWCVN
jgi:hypothetical protein